jgi:hypothetical protein
MLGSGAAAFFSISGLTVGRTGASAGLDTSPDVRTFSSAMMFWEGQPRDERVYWLASGEGTDEEEEEEEEEGWWMEVVEGGREETEVGQKVVVS